jgi:quinol-cytochrome oxidoreductase complex cytochrome b subunit
MLHGRRIVVVLPAYNAEATLERTLADIPAGVADALVLVDDASHDDTVAVARRLGLRTLVHDRNRGYGGNQKSCYREALALQADVVVMLHPDYQYSPRLLPALADMVRGGPDVGDFTVQRFFALHVVVLPALLIPLLGFHLWLVQRHGNAVPASELAKPVEQRKSVPFFPNFFVKDVAMWLVALNVLALMASFFPWTLGKPADSLMPAPAGIHPEWYFMSAFQTLKILGAWFPGAAGEALGVIVFNLGLVLWALIPFYDGSSKAGQRGRRAHYFGLIVLGAIVVTTIAGYWSVR